MHRAWPPEASFATGSKVSIFCIVQIMDINDRAQVLVQKIKHLTITTCGRTADLATNEQFYLAFTEALREEIMTNWTASIDTLAIKKPRTINYLSMEYLPGRMTYNNIANIGATELVQAVLQKMNRSYHDFIRCEPDPGLGNGGLGRLASCLIDSLASLHYPARAYGLRYQYGVFEQEIWNGIQIERPDCWLLNTYPWEARRDDQSVNVHFRGKMIPKPNRHGDEVFGLEDFEEVRALPYDTPIIGYSEGRDFSVLTLRLWSTKESPRNFQLQRFNAGFLDQASENLSLTDVLYPNDQTEVGRRVRLKQEMLLVSASLKDIVRRHLQWHHDLSEFADKVRIQINDTHPALIIAEMIRILTKNFDVSWKRAIEITQTICSYTNHTILREALEEWQQDRLKELLPRQLQVIQKLNLEFCDSIRDRYPHDEDRVRRMSIIEDGQVRMAHLAIYGSHKVNGVAQLHSEILKSSVFKDFYEMYPDRFVNVTNGVTQRRWLNLANPLLSNFISERIGRSWIHDFPQIAKLSSFASDSSSQKAFLEIKRKNKQALIDYLKTANGFRNANGQIVSHPQFLDPAALFDVQVKRFHEYKRQLLNALHLIMLYQELQESKNSRVPRLAIFGGKAAAGYERAKQIMQLICCMSRKINRDETVNKHLQIIFIENYNVSKAEIIMPAADLSEQISTAGLEASGTGNMKFAINGALTIGTDDGANVEMREAITNDWWPFLFGASAQENASAHHHYHAKDIYSKDNAIRKALDTLKDGTFAENSSEQAVFTHLHDSLLRHDQFFVLRDLRSYYETQKKVEELYRHPDRWAETAIHNIAGMGRFSTDESIHNYVKRIWNIQPCSLDRQVLFDVNKDYSGSNIYTERT